MEIATAARAVHVRDSKHLAGPRLAVAPTACAGLLTYASEG
ncbi:DUF397 domain-containing protein [Streptomyces sp. DH24]